MVQALEERYIDLRNKETDVEAQRRTFAEELAGFTRQREVCRTWGLVICLTLVQGWLLKESAHQDALKRLNERCDDATRDRDSLKLVSVTQFPINSDADAQYQMLKEQNSGLETQEGSLKRMLQENERVNAVLTPLS